MKAILSGLAIFGTTFVVWKGVLTQALIGEGPTYFVEPYLSIVEKGGLPELWGRHDVSALLFFHFAKDFFRDSMASYMIVLLIGASLVVLSVFILVKSITKSFAAGFVASLLLISNFVGSYEILGLGYYQWFIQRVPNFSLALFGFWFLVKYLERKKIKYYLFSLLTYLLATYLARYTIHILPLFVIFTFLKGGNPKKALLQVIPFILGSYVLMKAQSLVAGESIFEFMTTNINLIPSVFYQLSVLSFPFVLNFPRYLLADTVKIITPIILAIYLLAAFLVIKKDKKLLPIIITLLVCIPLSIYLSIFLNPYFVKFYDSSRYLYFTSILIAIFWGIVTHIFIRQHKFFKIALVLFISIWFVFNKNQISKGFEGGQEKHLPVLKTIEYLNENVSSFNDGSYVLVPPEVGHYGSGMLDYFYNDRKLNFSPDLDYEEKPKEFILLKYDAKSSIITRLESHL